LSNFWCSTPDFIQGRDAAVKVGVEVDGLETRATRESLDHCDERQNRLVLDG
jgi:hypothetical protein